MIAASEPLEFVPHGRRAIARHPGSVLKSAATNSYPCETSLLHKLKNVVISDRSDCTYLQKDRENLNEWWCVRQIYPNSSRKQSNDHDVTVSSSQMFKPQAQRVNDTDNPSMKLKHDFNQSIKTELSTSTKKRGNDSALPNSSRLGSSISYVNSSKSITIPSPLSSPEDGFRSPDPKVDCCFEEELYVKGKTAIWSRGHISNPDSKLYDPESRVTVTSYTCETNIKHALFCNFHSTVNDRLMYDALNTLITETKSYIKIKDNFEEESLNPIPSICITDHTTLRVFTEDGQDFITSLQFQVKKIWSTKYGILLEKDAAPPSNTSYVHNILNSRSRNDMSTFKTTGNRTSMGSGLKMHLFTPSQDNFGTSTTFGETEVQLPTCFSLSHPLDEMAPALMKVSQYELQYYNDGSMQIVFVSENPSIALIFCSKTGLHSLYTLRKATSEECHSVCSNWNKTASALNPSGILNLGNSLSMFNTTSQKNIAGNAHKSTAANWLGGVASPFTSRPTSALGSPSHSRTESPMAGLFNRLGLSPHTSIGQASNSSMLAPNTRPAPPTQPLYPDLCFEHIWTECQGVSRDNVSIWSAATKTFLHSDHTNQRYLCYLISSNTQLQIARLERPHSNTLDNSRKHLIVGAVNSIPARDAVVLPTLNSIAIIDLSGNIILYSGMCMIGKVHVGGVLAGLITSPYNQTSVFDTSFPKRSSLLPTSHSRDVPLLDDSALHQLSPVPRHFGMHSVENKTIENGGLQCLRDPVGNRVTLEYDKGILYRITLPDLTTNSLISKCINALKQVLQKDVVMQVISKWYGIRNAPGTQDLCPKLEWSMFVSLILNLLGYDVSKLPLTKQTDSGNTEVATKKQRTSCDGSQEDWEYLLNSNHHISIGNSLASMLNLKNNSHNSKSLTNGQMSNPVKKFSDFTKTSSKVPNEMDVSSPEDCTHSAQTGIFNTISLLFPYMLPILYSFHLVYEELKMNVLLVADLEPLAQLLHQICVDLKLTSYVVHYWKDFPLLCPMNPENNQSQISEQDIKRLNHPAYFTSEPPSIFNHLFQLMRGSNGQVWFPFLSNVNTVSRDVIEVTGLITNGAPGLIQTIMSARDCVNASSTPRIKDVAAFTDLTKIEQAVVLMICMKGYTLRDLQTLPPAINLYIINTISQCKTNPPVDWPDKAYSLIMREDLAVRAKYSSNETHGNNMQDESMKETLFTHHKDPDPEHLNIGSKVNEIEKTGLEHVDTKIMRLRFPDDHRVAELCNMLQSSIPVTIALTQRPEVSDHDFIEEQERHLLALCNRTMALSVGRGMVTLRSTQCVITEPLHIPKLCLTGRAPPRNAVIDLSHIEVSPTVSQWPLFHNGVAAGLKLVPTGNSTIDSAWVVYNKPKVGNAQDLPTEHAGFLMALGLNGHLKDMAFMNVYEYLVKCHEMTSVGLLLGIASTYRGTMDVSITKLMGIHVEALLPPTSIELDIPQNIQVAALLGVGLLYQKTAHTHITQVLLSEIGRPPGPEMENSSEREGYALAAGLALGLVVLGAHRSAPQHLAPALTHYMLGGNKKPLTGSQKEKYKLPSFQIREGPTVNVDVTAPGATLALGMLYLKSGNTEVAKWFEPPPTHYLLNHVRPDLLLLRVIARGLILWESIEPYEEWVEDYVPESIKPYCCVRPNDDHTDIDYEAMNQVYCNIVAGACFSIGLRYAGSANQDARDTILFYVKKLIMFGSKSIGELAGKATTETCLNLVLISAAMVMAGTGDLDIMRLCRYQRSKAGPSASSLSYGSQVAVHSALGLLFLGAGRYTLSTSSEAVVALVCAFFPKFPLHSNDNRYHLQAFRHLYVLAAEPRLLIPRDITSGKICYANVQVVTVHKDQLINLRGPCLLPELEKLKEVRVSDDRYWSIVFKRNRNWDQLLSLLEKSTCLDVKQRAGCLSYLEDPQGFQSLLAQMLTTEKTNVWSAKPENVFAFSNNPAILNFTKHYLFDALSNALGNKIMDSVSDTKNEKSDDGGCSNICSTCYFAGVTRIFKEADKSELALGKRRSSRISSLDNKNLMKLDQKCLCDKNNKEEREFIQVLAVITYECVIRDTLSILPVWITLVKILQSLSSNPSVYHIWQLKLLFAHTENHNNKYKDRIDNTSDSSKRKNEPLISNEFAFSLKQKAEYILDSWEHNLGRNLKSYIQVNQRHSGLSVISDCDSRKLTSYITYYDIPNKIFTSTGESAEYNILDLFAEKDKWNLDSCTIQKIVSIVNSHFYDVN